MKALAATRMRSWHRPFAAAVASACLLALPGAALAHENDDAGVQGLIRIITRARVIDLSHTWDKHSPIASVNPTYEFHLEANHSVFGLPGGTRGQFGDGGQLSFTSELMHFSGQHGAPSIDAIGHIGRDGKLFGGVDAAASTSNPDGIGTSGIGAQLAIDQFPTRLLVSRGVLLDVATLIQGDSQPLPETFEITAEHLIAAAKRQHVQLRRSDTILIRTGWGQFFKSDAAKYAGGSSPGPGLDAAEFLIKIGAKIVGNDTLTFEQRPPVVFVPKFQVFPVHMRLITDSGIYIVENLNLEALAAARAYEFAVVIPPLKILGGTGSALRAFALVPKK